ncbi:MAG TPA: ABC transporter permease [Firmicutes bacterium]|jgi:peptide/nickel transport system permease protein|nr:ABC transporter permease [Bacillota bacterium]
MKRYLLNRLLILIPVMLGVCFITFLMVELTPGDPAEIILLKRDIGVTPEALAVARRQLGMEGPVLQRFINWLGRAARGDLGYSYTSGEAVAKEIFRRLPATLELAAGGLLVMLFLALSLGILAALFPRTAIDHLSRLTALLGASLPSFYLGLLLICYLAVPSPYLQVMGLGGLSHLLLPSLTLGFGLAAVYARLLRSSLLEVLQLDFIRAARARGLREAVVIGKHALRNALIPLVTVFGITVGGLLGGTVVVEQVFAWPGVGRLAVQAIFDRDIPVIQGYALFMALIYVLVNLAVDISYRYLDPRIKLGRKETG